MTSRRMLLVILVLATSACIQLQGLPPASRYFLLEPMSDVDKIHVESTLAINIEVVDFPDYLRRPQVVVQQQDNILHFSDSQRWATALEENIAAVLRNNVEQMIPAATVLIGPWHGSQANENMVQLSVRKFTGILGQHSDVDIRWRVIFVAGNELSGTFTHRHAIDDSYEELIRALNLALAKLSKELVTVLLETGA